MTGKTNYVVRNFFFLIRKFQESVVFGSINVRVLKGKNEWKNSVFIWKDDKKLKINEVTVTGT